MKLWKVTVNQLGWDSPATYYAKSREDAKAIADKHPASDGVEYAGNFSDAKAKEILQLHGYEVEQ